jgi:putative transposase
MNQPSSDNNPLALGGHFVLDGDSYTSKSYISLQSMLAVREHDGAEVTVQIKDIVKAFAVRTALDEEESIESDGTATLKKEDWTIAEKRAAKIQVLIESEHCTRTLVAKIAKQLGRSPATIYRWRAKYLKTGNVVSIAPHHPKGGRGKPRIDLNSNAIIDEVLEDRYLTKQRYRPAKLMTEIETRCKRAKLPVPHINTVRRRIAALDEGRKARAREGKNASKKYLPAPGRYKGADFPNAVWQIDHTPVDVCIVDDVHRRNIGRCWITVAIDVFSRCVVGYYLSLDKPNATSVGMCLVNAILPKDGWLAAHGVRAPWSVWGRPRKVHADNDKTFRCEMVSRAAKQYKFDLEWRPVRTPHWGGHIERLLGTFNDEIHTLPGTTFSTAWQRGEYKSHKEAKLTFSELETYVTEYLCGFYHQQFHKGIQRAPIKRYEAGVLGDGIRIGTGLPAPENDPARLRLDFLPFKECTVQSYGIVLDNITYYDPLVDPWIHSRDPKTKKKRKFICRRDPRDISHIWFLDPEKDIYFKIPYRNVEYPSINLWELREVRKQLRKEGYEEVNEALIFDTYDRLQQIVRNASQATQTTRKALQKKKTYASKARAEEAQVKASEPKQPRSPSAVFGNANTSSITDTWNDDDEVARFVEAEA